MNQATIKGLKLGEISQMKLVCDNQVALHKASDPVFQRIKYIDELISQLALHQWCSFYKNVRNMIIAVELHFRESLRCLVNAI